MRWGTAHASVHPNILRHKLLSLGTVIGLKEDFFTEIEVFGQEKGQIYYISHFRQKTVKIGALKLKFFPKKGHSKIWSAKFFSVRPNSAPSLCPCVTNNFLQLN